MEDNYMRTLVLLRGIPASGKSTWIKENKLEAYTLSSDHIRTYQNIIPGSKSKCRRRIHTS